MRTVIISILGFALVIAFIVKVALPSVNANGKAVKDRTEEYYKKAIEN